MQLDGKFAVVTGGASGIGLAITRALRAAGTHVLAIGRNRARLDALQTQGPGVSTLVADVARASDRDRVIEHVLHSPTPVDLFVNNAGTMTEIDLRRPNAMAAFDAELAVNLQAPIHFATALLPYLLQRPEAALVNVTTGLVYAPLAAMPAYGASKNGLHAFTQSLRRQTRGSTLHVLEVLPPSVDTALTKAYGGSKAKPEVVGHAVVRALTRGAAEVRIGQVHALYAISRIAPGLAFGMINKGITRA